MVEQRSVAPLTRVRFPLVAPTTPRLRRASGPGSRRRRKARRSSSVGGQQVHKIIFVYYVYILKLNSGKPYVGSSPSLKERLKEHQQGESKYTSNDLPFKLIAYICFADRLAALRFERYLKTGSGRALRKKHLGI